MSPFYFYFCRPSIGLHICTVYGENRDSAFFYKFDAVEQYDAVTLFEVIEHLTSPYMASRSIGKMLRPNGMLVNATPRAYYYHG